jgi:hypothetical protein
MQRMNLKLLATLFYQGTISLLGTTVFCLTINQQSVHAQRSASLFSMCQFTGAGYDYSQDVTIGRELFTSVRALWAYGGSAICRIRPGDSAYKYKTLRLAFGIQDQNADNYNCRRPMTVNVYLDGNLEESRSLLPSEKSLLLLNVSRTSTVTVDVPEIGGCWGVVHFTQAILEPISTSSGRRY